MTHPPHQKERDYLAALTPCSQHGAAWGRRHHPHTVCHHVSAFFGVSINDLWSLNNPKPRNPLRPSTTFLMLCSQPSGVLRPQTEPINCNMAPYWDLQLRRPSDPQGGPFTFSTAPLPFRSTMRIPFSKTRNSRHGSRTSSRSI